MKEDHVFIAVVFFFIDLFLPDAKAPIYSMANVTNKEKETAFDLMLKNINWSEYDRGIFVSDVLNNFQKVASMDPQNSRPPRSLLCSIEYRIQFDLFSAIQMYKYGRLQSGWTLEMSLVDLRSSYIAMEKSLVDQGILPGSIVVKHTPTNLIGFIR